MGKEIKQPAESDKSYDDSVQFPVEIVGKDGIVRHYSFEESVRLYRRRVNVANVRYPEGTTREREVQHCFQRISQLRRSFFCEFGWEGETPSGDFYQELGEHSGEIAAFLQRSLALSGRLSLRVQRVKADDTHRSMWLLQPWGSGAALMLTVYRFADERWENPSRQAYHADLSRVKRVDQSSAEEECWVSHTLGFDFAILATVHTAALWKSGLWLYGVDRRADSGTDAWRAALRCLEHEQWADALDQCRSLVKAQPMHRRAYLLGALSALRLQRALLVEELSLVGGLYFPNEPQFGWLLRWARLKLERPDEQPPINAEAVDFGLVITAYQLVKSAKLGALLSALRALRGRSVGQPEHFLPLVLALLFARVAQVGGLFLGLLSLGLGLSFLWSALFLGLMSLFTWVLVTLTSRLEAQVERTLREQSLAALPRA